MFILKTHITPQQNNDYTLEKKNILKNKRVYREVHGISGEPSIKLVNFTSIPELLKNAQKNMMSMFVDGYYMSSEDTIVVAQEFETLDDIKREYAQDFL